MRDTKHLEKHANKLAESKKEKELFRTQRKAVEAGAHGTLEYTIKKGVNKNKIADDKILKSKNRLNALVFSDDKDKFETPESLSFLIELKDLKLIDLTNSSCHKGHEAVKEKCFEPFVKKNNYISDYLKNIVN